MKMEGAAPASAGSGEQGKSTYLDYIKQKQGEIKAELDAKEAKKDPPSQDFEPTGQRASVSRRGALSFGPVQHTAEPRVDAEGNVFHPIDQKSHEYLERVRKTQEDARRQTEEDIAAKRGSTGQVGSGIAPAPAPVQARQEQTPPPATVIAGASEAAPAPQVSPEEIARQAEAMARQEREKKDNLTLYRIVSGDSKAKEIPAGFEPTLETKEAAGNFFRSKEQLVESYKKEFQAKRLAKKSGYEQGGAALAETVIWRENAQKDYEHKLEGLKKELFEDFIVKKHEKYPNLTKKEMQEEALKYSAGFVLETAKDIDIDLEAEKNRVAYETKERGIASKLWEKYTKAPKWKKWAIGAGLAGAVGLGGALLFPSTLLFAGSAATLSKVGVGGFLATKAVRSVTGGALGAAIFSGIEKFHIRGKYGKKRMEAGAGQSAETLEKLKQEIGTAEDWLENEAIKMKLMTIVDADAIKYREKLGKIANKEGRSRLYAALAAGIIGGAAATAAGLDWSQVFPGGPKGAALVGALENKPSGGQVDYWTEQQLAPEGPSVPKGGGGVGIGTPGPEEIKPAGTQPNLDWQMERPTEPNLDWQMENPPKGPVVEPLPETGGEEVIPEGHTGSSNVGGEDLSEVPKEGEVGGGEENLEAGGAEELPKVSEFGTTYETQVAERFGFSPDQFEATKGITVEKLLAEIPIDKDEQVKMWERFSQNNPPDIWPSENPYYSSILKKQVELAELLWTRFPRPDINPEMQKMTIGEVINLLHLGPR